MSSLVWTFPGVRRVHSQGYEGTFSGVRGYILGGKPNTHVRPLKPRRQLQRNALPMALQAPLF